MVCKKNRDLLDYYIDLTKPLPIALQKKAEQCKNHGITLRPFNRWQAKQELMWWVALFMETFQDHWGYVPTREEEVLSRFGIKQMRWFIDPKLFLIAEYQANPIAYIWAMPEYNQLFKRFKGRLGLFEIVSFFWKQRTITEGKLYLIGITKKWRNQYLASYLNYAVLSEMQKRGFTGAVCGWLDEQNIGAHHTIALTNPSVYKRYRIYEKHI
ncbi:MAG: hypothetical protein KKC68_04320 [Candidatus Thermoplasmatota archaeon]|nr:hypothetical protein [Candidatus Thermoplasmatota archaeon]MBU1940976.1 hypothetical protein [Candidatus Thermoplasmatota archaeon]